MSNDAKRLTREELGDQVWSEPLLQLAKKFGISDSELAKACRRMRIPCLVVATGRRNSSANQYAERRSRTSQRMLDPPRSSCGRGLLSQPRRKASQGPAADQEPFEALEENRIIVPDTRRSTPASTEDGCRAPPREGESSGLPDSGGARTQRQREFGRGRPRDVHSRRAP
jgi:hypothetical protein